MISLSLVKRDASYLIMSKCIANISSCKSIMSETFSWKLTKSSEGTFSFPSLLSISSFRVSFIIFKSSYCLDLCWSFVMGRGGFLGIGYLVILLTTLIFLSSNFLSIDLLLVGFFFFGLLRFCYFPPWKGKSFLEITFCSFLSLLMGE